MLFSSWKYGNMYIVQNPCWLMIIFSSGIILPNVLQIINIIIIQERGIPINQPGLSGMTEGFWTLLKWLWGKDPFVKMSGNLLTKLDMGMDQYLLIPFLGGWTSIYQLFWCSPGVHGFDTLPYEFGGSSSQVKYPVSGMGSSGNMQRLDSHCFILPSNVVKTIINHP